MKKEKREKGITLIPLIITISLLIILVGATVAVLPDDLFDQAEEKENAQQSMITNSQEQINSILDEYVEL